LSTAEYARTTRKKRADTQKGKQFSTQPADVAHKTAEYREAGHAHPVTDSKAVLYERAKQQNIPGRSQMTKAELAKAVGG
jgi:hypothetical protein